MELREGLEPLEERMMTTQEIEIHDPFSVSIPAGTQETRFYFFRQNNSGGMFYYDDAGISTYVIVEARDVNQANQIAQNKGIYFDGCYDGRDCNCCGDRWYEAYAPGMTREEMVSEVNQIITSEWTHKWQEEGKAEIFLHMLSGDILSAWTHSLDMEAQ